MQSLSLPYDFIRNNRDYLEFINSGYFNHLGIISARGYNLIIPPTLSSLVYQSTTSLAQNKEK